ncbi:MAG TPA: tetratricopeptide repeat protein [Terriglobales bacterium]|nr:tetratricopeptide repeat protein [Terriglobales bacterium]
MGRRARYAVRLFAGELWLAATFLAFFASAVPNAIAQDLPVTAAESVQQPADRARAMEAEASAALRITIQSEDNQLLAHQAVVKLVNEIHQTTNWQTTSDHSEAVFADLSPGKYEVEVSAAGYITGRQEVQLTSVVDTVPVDFVLKRDPSVAEQNITAASMSPKTTQDMIRAIRALDANDLREAQKRLDEANRLAPSSAELKFLSAYLSYAKGDLEEAEKLLIQATALNPRYRHALTLLGRVQLVRGEDQQAKATLERAVAADSSYWVAHNLLADAYLQVHDYEKAQEQAELALEAHRRNAKMAQLALGEALVNLGKTPEAIAALKTFAEAYPRTLAGPHAEELVALLEKPPSDNDKKAAARLAELKSFAVATDLLPSAHAGLPELTWQPPGIDEEPPPVATPVNCPAQQVIEGAGLGVEQLVADVAKFAAIEDLVHERLDEMGNPTARETRKFDYAAAIYQNQPDVVVVDEYRTERYGLDNLPDRIADNGFAALALVFHPAMRDEFQMTCEGLGDWHGQPTWLVRFQQREDRPNRMQAYLVGGARYSVSLKGRAWITPEKFQVVRIETEMTKPMPQIGLMTEHQITEYGPVPFKKKNLELWLPKTAEVYMYFRGHRYYRKHSFEKYMLFSVDEEQKVREAKHSTPTPESRNSGQSESSVSQ